MAKEFSNIKNGKKIWNTNDGTVISWCQNPEAGAINQAIALSQLPFVYKHVALMPDTHQGYGMPIGGVVACDGYVIPNAVGVDIGCGMLAVKTSLTSIPTEDLKLIMGIIQATVPVGFKRHSEPKEECFMPSKHSSSRVLGSKVIDAEYHSAKCQLGTLGGGNHFIEIQKGDDGHIWFMVHSGSRNFGLKVAKFYNDKAVKLNKRYFNYTEDLAFLDVNSKWGKRYIADMNYALEFAQANRDMMARAIQAAFTVVCESSSVEFEKPINIHHNYAALEHHMGKNVWVHRKGATRAQEGELGIIPGSQGTASYIVMGKGNRESFASCSHGAGRKMGRKAAQRDLDLEKEKKALDDQGIFHSIRNEKDLDEASGAYKDIDIVMEEQKDLVDIVVKLTPLGVIKG